MELEPQRHDVLGFLRADVYISEVPGNVDVQQRHMLFRAGRRNDESDGSSAEVMSCLL